MARVVRRREIRTVEEPIPAPEIMPVKEPVKEPEKEPVPVRQE